MTAINNNTIVSFLYAECHYQGKSQDVVYAAGVINDIGILNPVPIATVLNTGTCKM